MKSFLRYLFLILLASGSMYLSTPAYAAITLSSFKVEDCVIRAYENICDINASFVGLNGGQPYSADSSSFTKFVSPIRLERRNREVEMPSYGPSSNGKLNLIYDFQPVAFETPNDQEKIHYRQNRYRSLYLSNGLALGLNELRALDGDGNILGTTTARATCEKGTIWTLFKDAAVGYCLPAIPGIIQNSGIQYIYSNAQSFVSDPDFGIEGYCNPGYTWQKKYTNIYGSSKNPSKQELYDCVINNETINLDDVTEFEVKKCILGFGGGCVGEVDLQSKKNVVFRIKVANITGLDSVSDFRKSNIGDTRYFGGSNGQGVPLQFGKNIIELQQIKQKYIDADPIPNPSVPGTVYTKFLDPETEIISLKSIIIDVPCPTGTIAIAQGTAGNTKIFCSTAETISNWLGTQISPGKTTTHYFDSITIQGKDFKSGLATSVSVPKESLPEIKGKIAPSLTPADSYSVIITSPFLKGNYISIPVKSDSTFDLKDTKTPKSILQRFFPDGIPTGLTFSTSTSPTTDSQSRYGAVLTTSYTSSPVPSTTPSTTPSTNTNTSNTNTPPKNTSTPPSDTTIVDTLDLDTSSLDLASKARIDKIIARVETRVSKMIYQIAIKFIDNSISRIQALPNKTTKAKLIDTYTIQKLQALRERLVSENEEDYIGLIDTSLSDQ